MRLAVLLSGRGSNFQAIHEAIRRGELAAEIVCVISNRPDAPGIGRARDYGYAAHTIDHKAFANRASHEEEVLRVLDDARPDFICLAGYMRLLGAGFIERWRNRIINIHPSLLPSFPGVDAQAQAVAYGVKVSGCTVHLVDEQLDAGPILVQRTVPVHEDDTGETVAARILVEEHEAYVEALRKLGGPWRIDGRRVVFG
ncbi:MAG TPA: phosphoribosylglycinamide formyltransferase [Thermoanaerobaculia bacterium]|jgi:phosphoribosylglycinamide formyltransferase-1|nr:phosphoribosylglycinamide formyltransferase [Thermoanaerobaculia bacterium]